jgi:hypothetical protein
MSACLRVIGFIAELLRCRSAGPDGSRYAGEADKHLSDLGLSG